MSPTSPLPAPDHQRHDELLVAQFAMGDPLADAQRSEAQRLLADCGACALLAADMRTLAGSVAWEPVPPRRRDFRLDADQAERLAGNPLGRFLRRLSLPRARAFGPAAAGVFSVGLAFVVVGYAWPSDEALELSTEPMSAPALNETYAASPALTQELAPAADELTVAAEGAPDESEAFMADEQSVLGAAAEEAPDRDTAAKSSREPAGMSDAATMAEEPAAPAGVADSELMVAVESPGAGGLVADDAAQAADGAARTANGVGSDHSSAVARAAGPGIETWLITVGGGLAAVGALLLLLAALVRRTADPLLR